MAPDLGKPLVLIICDYYLPGFESGGAMRTLVNMVDRLGDEYRFRVITRDHDGPFNRTSYTNVNVDKWNHVKGANVYYLSKRDITRKRLRDLIHETQPDAIYLNSFFSPLTIFTLILRRFSNIPPIPIVLAPEGELVPGALKLKPLKKQLYIYGAKLLSLLKPVIWKAAASSELQDVEKVFSKDTKIFVAPNLPPVVDRTEIPRTDKPTKVPGEAKLVFLSRFMRKKNLNWLLEHIQNIRGELSIDIFGPLEDIGYWEETERIINFPLPLEANGVSP